MKEKTIYDFEAVIESSEIIIAEQRASQNVVNLSLNDLKSASQAFGSVIEKIDKEHELAASIEKQQELYPLETTDEAVIDKIINL